MKQRMLIGCIAIFASAAQAQRSSEDAAAWYGIMITPVGAFPSISANTSARTEWALSGSRWKLPVVNEGQNSFAVTYLPRPADKMRYEATVGWFQPGGGAGADDGAIMLGAAAGAPFWRSAAIDAVGSAIELGWKASFGFSHSRGNGGSEYWSAVGQVPLRWSYQAASKSVLSAFASAGYGVAGVGDYADADQGTRPLVSFGGGWTAAGGFGIHLGTLLVPGDIEGVSPPWVASASISIPLGR